MLNLTADQAKKLLTDVETRIAAVNAGILDIDSQIKRLRVSKFDLQAELTRDKAKRRAAQKALILIRGVSPKIAVMHKRWLGKLARSQKDDVTVAESRTLAADVEIAVRELQNVCVHQFIYHREGYEGDHLHEYENRRPNHRYCVICGYHEDGKQKDQYDYQGKHFTVLTEADNRTIENEPWKYGKNNQVDIRLPLGAVLHPFEESVVKVLNS